MLMMMGSDKGTVGRKISKAIEGFFKTSRMTGEG